MQTLSSNTAPDRRYLWLDLVEQVTLEAGTHTIDLTYAGTELSRRVVIDGLLIQPIEARRVFTGPENARLTLTYNTQTGQISLNEE
jgi:hypothetical protein